MNYRQRFTHYILAPTLLFVFITRGHDGAIAYDALGAVVHRPGVLVKVVDTVGAGDTFQAAVLHWLQQHECANTNSLGRLNEEIELEDCVDFAVRAAAVTVSRRGANLPRLADITND